MHRLPGVTGAEANPLTGNVLIRFEPLQTDASPLLEALAGLHLDVPVIPPVLDVTIDQPAVVLQKDGSVFYVTGMSRLVYQVLGWTSVGLAVVGAITPGLPTAPFVILAGYLFIRSSPAAHEWLRQSRWFGPILRDWEAFRGVRRSVRNAALALIGGSMILTAFLPLPPLVKVTIFVCQVIGAAIVLQLRVVDADPLPVSPRGTEA
jgi:uncharacterized membrane protein YbaN (DUF454 family)